MNASNIRDRLTRSLPQPMRRPLSRARQYVKRMSGWAHVLGSVRGSTAQDRMVVRKSALRAPLDMLRRLDEWREPTLDADAEIDISGYGRFAVRGGSDDLGHVLPNMHAKLFEVIRMHVSAGDITIDAGANIGAITVFLARQVGPSGRVIAVEMMPDTAARLRHNISLNRLENVSVVENALSDTVGKTVEAEVAQGVFGQASIAAGANPGRNVRRVAVTTTTLDTVVAGMGEIALMKVDLEGAEPMALAGAHDMLTRTRAIIFESWAGDGGRTAAILEDSGFVISPIDGRNFLALRAPLGQTSVRI